MKINNNNRINMGQNPNQPIKEKNASEGRSYDESGLDNIAAYNKAAISFKGYDDKGYKGTEYCGDPEPANRLFWILTGRHHVYADDVTNANLYRNLSERKWVKTNPEDLLKRTPEEAIQSICTVADNFDLNPHRRVLLDYGPKWGRRANYIEINPRTVAMTIGDEKQEGLLNVLKLLPAIPPSANSFANCIVLSQLYPAAGNYDDNKTGNRSLYGVDLNSGISKNLTSKNLYRYGEKMSEGEQVKAFNDLAHIRGLKTGIRMPLSSGQMTVEGKPFNWYDHEKAFIDACVLAVNLGFDCIFFDSAKHVGWNDMDNYHGIGDLPNFQQMQYITSQIRERTGRGDISLVGEKCNDDIRFNQMGLTAGTDWGRADNYESVMHEYKKQRWNDEYAAGPMISDDNDDGSLNFETRLNRIKNAFNAYEEVGYRLPTFMQMADIFPLHHEINTHQQMENSQNRSAYGDIESSYNNIFNTSGASYDYRMKVYNEFANSFGQ